MLKIIIIDQEETKVFQSESFEEIEKALDYFYSDVEEEVAQPEFSTDGLLELRELIKREKEFEPEDIVITPLQMVGIVTRITEDGKAVVKKYMNEAIPEVEYDFASLEHFDFDKYCEKR